MPFKSEKQRRYLWANEPEIAREWTDRYGAANGGIFDQWGQHATATEAMKLMNEPDYHQKAGYNFMQNFPDTPQWLADTLATGYQYGSEGFKALKGGTDFGEALDRAKEEARLNKLGIRGLGFDMGEYENFMDNYNSANESSTPEISFVPNALNQASIYPSNLYSGIASAATNLNAPFMNSNVSDPSVMQPHDFEFGDEWIEGSDKGGILDWITNKGTGIRQGLSLANENYLMPAVAGVLGIANRYNPLKEGSQNYNKDLQGQVDMLDQMGMLGDQSSPYKITGGVLAGKNLVSAFGTNDYGRMLDKRIEYFRNKKSLTETQNRKMHEAIAEKKAADEAAKKAAQTWQQRYSNWRSPTGRDHAGTAGIGSKESKQGHGGSSHVGASRFK